MEQPPPSHLLPPGSSRVIGAVFIALLVLGFVSSLIALSRTRPPEGASMVTGAWTAEFERRFDREQPYRRTAIDVWGVLEYTLFRDGRDGVLIGDDGWLFTSEEFEQTPNDDEELARKLSYIGEVRERLAAVGSELVVALLPAKARIYPEHLGRYRLPGAVETRYARFRDALIEAGIRTPDLLTALLEAKSRGEVFLRTDTHWTPFGARIVAGAVADVAAQHRMLSPHDASGYLLRAAGTTGHRGDLLGFVPLGPLQERIGPAADRLELFELDAPAGGEGAGLFGDVSIPVTLVGTSYSANALWAFEAALKEALAADVLNVADEGRGPLVPMAHYLTGPNFGDAPPELVVWEIPERFLAVEYDLP